MILKFQNVDQDKLAKLLEVSVMPENMFIVDYGVNSPPRPVIKILEVKSPRHGSGRDVNIELLEDYYPESRESAPIPFRVVKVVFRSLFPRQMKDE